MKLGLILECPNQGTDHQVYNHVITRLCPDISLNITGCVNKKDLINKCGPIAKTLLESDRCDHVAVIWDAMPTWGGEPCRKKDIAAIKKSLEEEKTDLSRIKLICMEPELEGWLLVDGRALTIYKRELCRPHPAKSFPSVKLSSNSNQAKKIISRYLGHPYNDIFEAIAIVKKFSDFSRIARKHPSFSRFHQFILHLCR